MANDSGSHRLARLKADVGRSLRANSVRSGFLVPGSQGVVPTISPTDVSSASGALTVNVNLVGGTIFLDDERRVRALAKEIKRLISEDTRRGLGV